MLGKRTMSTGNEAAPCEWGCAAVCNIACIRTGDALCKCSKSTAKRKTQSFITKRKSDHVRNLSSSSD